MKRFMTMLALAAIACAPASADVSGGVLGRVVDLNTGRPLANAAIAIYRLPVHENSSPLKSTTSDKTGYFRDITLEPGRYLITAEVIGLTSSCVIDDVFGGQATHIKIEIGPDGQRCVGPRVHSAVINPANTADEYVVR